MKTDTKRQKKAHKTLRFILTKAVSEEKQRGPKIETTQFTNEIN
jgi:hypothetical protein